MQERGYLNQCTDLNKLTEICNKKPITGYIGFDCTARSLHVGSLLQIMILKLMQKYGHRPIVLLGWWNYINWRSIGKKMQQEKY